MTGGSSAARAAAEEPQVQALEDSTEDARTQRRRLAGVLISAGSAIGAMVAASWYVVLRNGRAPGGDMLGHAATAEWLRTLPWWDWRGWSDWFYGGQAIGVNYPPLSHMWMRFTDPDHGQMAAVAVGLVVLLPWGSLRLARAVGFTPAAQRGAVGAVLVVVAASGNMHWVLSGFHSHFTFYGSWPAMLAAVTGLFCAAWATRCRRPAASGALAGVAVLLNASIVPGIAVVCLVLLATSGATLWQGIRWATTAATAALAVCSWWLVPFLAGRDRLVRWEVSLSETWRTGGFWLAVVLATVGAAAGWAGRFGSRGSQRLALAALTGLLATLAADLFGYLRPERWMEASILVAALAAGALMSNGRDRNRGPSVRPTWILLAPAFLIVLVVVTQRLELLPLGVWLLVGAPLRAWAWSGALAWAGVLLWVPFVAYLRNPVPEPSPSLAPLEAVAGQTGSDGDGLVYLDGFYNTALGDVRSCGWGHPWGATIDTGGRVRPLFGLYRETSATAEFLTAEILLRSDTPGLAGRASQDWNRVWEANEDTDFDSRARADALGADWYAACDRDGTVSVTDLSADTVSGVHVAASRTEAAWHRSAVEWWLALGTVDHVDGAPLPVFLSSTDEASRPADQAATGLSMRTAQDAVAVTAESAGWAWLRVPWDPWWRSEADTPVLKGGPGHLVIWAPRGTTHLRWEVPRQVDATAAATTAASLLAAAALTAANRRRRFEVDRQRQQPVAEALDEFANTVDGWWQAIPKRKGPRNE